MSVYSTTLPSFVSSSFMRKEDDCTSKSFPTRVSATILHLFFFARQVQDGGKVAMATCNAGGATG